MSFFLACLLLSTQVLQILSTPTPHTSVTAQAQAIRLKHFPHLHLLVTPLPLLYPWSFACNVSHSGTLPSFQTTTDARHLDAAAHGRGPGRYYQKGERLIGSARCCQNVQSVRSKCRRSASRGSSRSSRCSPAAAARKYSRKQREFPQGYVSLPSTLMAFHGISLTLSQPFGM